MPLTLEEALVALLMPDRGGGLAFLPEGVDGYDPVAGHVASAVMAEGRSLDRLLGQPVAQAHDLEVSLAQLVDAITGDSFLRVAIPFQLRRAPLLPAEHVDRLRGNGQGIGRPAALRAQPIHGSDEVRV